MAGVTAHDPQEGRSKPTAAFATHAMRVYSLMAAEARTEEIGGETKLVFRGKVTDIFAKAEISQSYYTRIFRTLTSMDAITLVQRGARNVDTVYVLHGKPSEDDFAPTRNQGLTEQRGNATVALEQRVKNLETQLGGINLKKALSDMENRLKKLEANSGKTT